MYMWVWQGFSLVGRGFFSPVTSSPISESVSCRLTPVHHIYFLLVLDNPKPEPSSPGKYTGGDWRGRISYVDMLAKLLPRQPRRQLFFGTGSHCWLRPTCFPSGPPDVRPWSWCPEGPHRSAAAVPWADCHGAGLCSCLCWASPTFASPLWWALLEQQPWPPACWQLPTVWSQLQTCWKLWCMIHFYQQSDEQ